jgi:hypothetical protein
MQSSRIKPVSLGRHRRNCAVCAHPERLEIETEFVAWRSPAALAQQFGLTDRASIYRHAHALGLFAKRQRNVRAALERIIERAGDVEVTASAVVSAIQVYARINANGQWIDPSESISLHQLFERMTREELQAYAETGRLPGWFPASVTTDALTTGAKDA